MVRTPEATEAALRAELTEVQRNYDDLLNGLMEDAPRCWDGDSAMEYLLTSYLRHLERMVEQRNRVPRLARHQPTCNGHC